MWPAAAPGSRSGARRERLVGHALEEGGADRVAGEHRHFVEDKHRVPKQHLGVKIAGTVGGQQVVQIERERRVREPVAVGRARGQTEVAPALIFGRLEEKKIQPVRRRRGERNAIRRLGGDGHIAAENRGKIVLDDAVLQKAPQPGADRGDGERRAHLLSGGPPVFARAGKLRV